MTQLLFTSMYAEKSSRSSIGRIIVRLAVCAPSIVSRERVRTGPRGIAAARARAGLASLGCKHHTRRKSTFPHLYRNVLIINRIFLLYNHFNNINTHVLKRIIKCQLLLCRYALFLSAIPSIVVR